MDRDQPPAASNTRMLLPHLLVLLCLMACAMAGGCGSSPVALADMGAPDAPQHAIHHVLLIGLDGARADAIRDHAGPTIRGLIDSGTACWRTQATLPSVTQVNWASILTGSMPDRHGIDRHPVTEAELAAMPLRVPTVFDAVADAGHTAAGFLGHWKLYPNESTHPLAHIERSSYESHRVAPRAADYIVRHRPAFCFVYLGDLDGLGHRHGWMSSSYLDGLARIDDAVQTLLNALEQAGIRERTLIILTSDHGGRGRSHSENHPECREVPLVITGPGIRPGHVIPTPLSVTQIAPTILQALSLPTPALWNGHPIPNLRPNTPPHPPALR